MIYLGLVCLMEKDASKSKQKKVEGQDKGDERNQTLHLMELK